MRYHTCIEQQSDTKWGRHSPQRVFKQYYIANNRVIKVTRRWRFSNGINQKWLDVINSEMN